MKTLFLIGALLFVGILLTGIVLKWIVGVAWTIFTYALIGYVIYWIFTSLTGRRKSRSSAG